MEKFGIEKIKHGVVSAIKLAENIKEAKEDDGKITFVESVGIGASSFADIVKIVKNGKGIKDEYEDLSDTERYEVVVFVSKELGLSNGKVQNVVLKSLELLASIDSLVKSLR